MPLCGCFSPEKITPVQQLPHSSNPAAHYREEARSKSSAAPEGSSQIKKVDHSILMLKSGQSARLGKICYYMLEFTNRELGHTFNDLLSKVALPQFDIPEVITLIFERNHKILAISKNCSSLLGKQVQEVLGNSLDLICNLTISQESIKEKALFFNTFLKRTITRFSTDRRGAVPAHGYVFPKDGFFVALIHKTDLEAYTYFKEVNNWRAFLEGNLKKERISSPDHLRVSSPSSHSTSRSHSASKSSLPLPDGSSPPSHSGTPRALAAPANSNGALAFALGNTVPHVVNTTPASSTSSSPVVISSPEIPIMHIPSHLLSTGTAVGSPPTIKKMDIKPNPSPRSVGSKPRDTKPLGPNLPPVQDSPPKPLNSLLIRIQKAEGEGVSGSSATGQAIKIKHVTL